MAYILHDASSFPLLQTSHPNLQILPIISVLNPVTDGDIKRSCLKLTEFVVSRKGAILKESVNLCIATVV